jgi:HemY protein
MIWSLIKILLFIAAVAGLTYGADLLLNSAEGMRISVAGIELTLGPLQTVILLLVLVVILWLVMKLVGLIVATLRFFNGDETAISRYFDQNRERKGYQALTEATLALASGEGRLALIRAQRAERFLGRPELTTLLMAQAAEAAGDAPRATQAYKTLLATDSTRFVGIRGLLKQKLAEGDAETALKLAEKAFLLKPKHPETQDILLKLQAASEDWKGARATLGAKMKGGSLPKDVYRRRDAVLALQQARGVMDETASIEAREAAIAANKLSPDLIPAAVMAARTLLAKGDKKSATRILKKSWEARPHPELAAAYAEIEPDEIPQERLKRFRGLIALHPEDDESKLLLAELNIMAEEYPDARRALGDIVTRHPTQRALAIMAAIERGEGSDDAVVRGWLSKAVTAPRGPQWCCDTCHAIHSDWAPICENCGGFDTLSWREPMESKGQSATGAELLPLLVNQPVVRTPTPEPAKTPDPLEDIIDLAAVARSAN